MRIVEILFSPTGGTARAARILAKALGPIALTVDLTVAVADFSSIALRSDDLCIIAVPAYGGRMPAVAAHRLAELNGCSARAVLMAVYGNRAFDDTLLEMEDVASAAGFLPVAGVGAIAEHSLIRRYGANRPDSRDDADLTAFACDILASLAKDKHELILHGNRPFKVFGGVPAKPYATELCKDCGLCAARCPVKAIDAAAPHQTNTEQCISCMRCVSICPSQARQIDPGIAAILTEKLAAPCAQRKENQLFL